MNPPEKIKEFFADYPLRVFKNGDLLLRPGDEKTVLYIEEGVVSQYDISAAGEKLVVNIYKQGAFVPLPSIVAGLPVDFFYEADGNVMARLAPQEQVRSFMIHDNEVLYDTLTRLSRGSDGLLKRVARMMEGGAEARILHELGVLRARFPSSDDSIKVTITQLSEQTGLARETVSRAVKKMREKGVITVVAGRFTLRD